MMPLLSGADDSATRYITGKYDTWQVLVRNAIIILMQDLYYEGARARAVLIEIGYRPAAIPEFRSAETFWPEVVLRLERGVVVDGMLLLVAVAARDHPDNEEARALLAQARGPGPVKVLCFLADPLRDSKLRIDREARLLKEIEGMGGFELQVRHAVRVNDLIQSILYEKPNILHFAGHGTESGQLVFEDDRGAPALVGPGDLARAISASSESVLDCVVMNSCYTAGNAESFRQAARMVAGSVSAISDPCALAFARGFYTGISAGQTPVRAYETGRAQMGLSHCDTSGLHMVSFPQAAF